MKGKITIDNKTYKLPLSYSDVNLKEFKVIQNFIDSDKLVTPFILENKGEPTEEDLINYYVKFINVVTNIPINTLMKVQRFTEDENIGIEDLFRSLTWLFVYPKENNKPVPKVLGYHFIDNTGIMNNNTLVEYTEANSINQALMNVDKDLNMLNLLLAIFYRPKKWFKIVPYNIDEVRQRAKEFDALDMQTVYDCLFFFIQSKKDYLKSIEESSVEKLEKALKPSRVTIGRYLSMILQKVEYLRLVVYLHMNRLINRIFTK